jgi:hypothetical protein
MIMARNTKKNPEPKGLAEALINYYKIWSTPFRVRFLGHHDAPYIEKCNEFYADPSNHTPEELPNLNNLTSPSMHWTLEEAEKHARGGIQCQGGYAAAIITHQGEVVEVIEIYPNRRVTFRKS